MMLQKVFKESYAKGLRDKVRAGIDLSDYSKEEFPYDKTMVGSIANLHQPKGLLEKMDFGDDLASAKALYEAYPGMTPLLASNDSFWTYLTHVDLFPYIQQRWPKVIQGEADKTYIENHWFQGGNFSFQTTLSGMWWTVYCTVDEDRGQEYKYEITDFLFSHAHFRELVGTSLFRHKEAVIGILEFLMENPELSSSYTKWRIRYIMKYFNQLGATKLLSYFNRGFFKTELEKKKDVLLNRTSELEIENDE